MLDEIQNQARAKSFIKPELSELDFGKAIAIFQVLSPRIASNGSERMPIS